MGFIRTGYTGRPLGDGVQQTGFGEHLRRSSLPVQRVSDRMNQLFLDIVGADPTADSNLFSGVGIVSGSYDVVVNAQEGRTLDVVTELNGASKRALTFSLIWALMEVAEKEAPRIIDTPLGMTSGAVKRRMVELLTPPAGNSGLPYQVVLFMTRSEIRDIEALVQDRAGVASGRSGAMNSVSTAVLQSWLGHRSMTETERYVELAGGYHDWVKRL